MEAETIRSNPMELQFILTPAASDFFPDAQHESRSSTTSVPRNNQHIRPCVQASYTLPVSARNGINKALPVLNQKITLPDADAEVLRRQKNCDAMRRVRQRRQNEILRMKEKIIQLEQQHQALASRCANTVFVGVQDPMVHVIELVKQLSAENLSTREWLQKQLTWKQRFRTILESMEMCTIVEKNQHYQVRDEAAALFQYFHPITYIAAKKIILDHTHTIHKIQERLLDGNDFHSTSSKATHLHVLGWNVHRRVEGSEMIFLFTKRYCSNAKISVYELMKKTWESDLGFERMQRFRAQARRWEVLQWVSNDVVVLGSDVQEPDHQTVFRTVSLRFRTEIKTEVLRASDNMKLPAKGYWIGTQSINPDSTPLISDGLDENEQLEWADLTVSMEFLTVIDPVTEEDHVEVRWSGKTNYKSEGGAFRDAADALSTLLRWELMAIGPVLNVISPFD